MRKVLSGFRVMVVDALYLLRILIGVRVRTRLSDACAGESHRTACPLATEHEEEESQAGNRIFLLQHFCDYFCTRF